MRPGWLAELATRAKAEKHLRARYAPGTVTDKYKINEILHHQFAFYAGTLNRVLPPIASQEYLELLLYQYDRSAEVDVLAKGGKLSAAQGDRWMQIGAALRRAIKYLAERVVLLSPELPLGENKNLIRHAEIALICAEELTRLYIESDRIIYHPGESSLEILPEGEVDIFRCQGESIYGSEMVARVIRDRQHREKYLSIVAPQMLPAEQEKYLADPFRQTIGMTLSEALAAIRMAIDQVTPPADGFKIPFCRKQLIVDEISRVSGLSASAVQRAIDGFTVTKCGMESEGREIFKPKQEYRAYRRAFFEMPHETGLHLAWSEEMAKESCILLGTGIPFGQVPREWASPKVKSAEGRLSNALGKWFESAVANNFQQVGILGVAPAKDAVGRGPTALPIPPNIGEIDFLGFSPKDNAVIIAECKCVKGALEPSFDRDDINEFVLGEDAYMKKLKKKSDWVFDNISAICTALSSVPGLKIGTNVRQAFSILITYYPSPAAFYWNETPCVSLTEFMLDYQEQGAWPYRTGVYSSV